VSTLRLITPAFKLIIGGAGARKTIVIGNAENEISKRTNIPKSTLIHHLKVLEKQNLIKTCASKGFKRYYPINGMGTKEKELVNLLREDTTREILFYIFYVKGCSISDISYELEKSPATILFHLRKLLKADIIIPMKSENGEVVLTLGEKHFVRKTVNNEIIYKIKDRSTSILIIKTDTTLETTLFSIVLAFITIIMINDIVFWFILRIQELKEVNHALKKHLNEF